MKTVLTIAGSDSSGGAGIQADIKTIAAHGLYATSAITALTAQNTMGVTAIQETTPDFLAAQLDAVFTDIPPDAVKIGMVANAALIAVIAEKLAKYKPAAIVADPVMVSTSGSTLLAQDALETLSHTLLPSAILITPNIHEAEVLWGQSIPDEKAMEAAARAIARQLKGPAVLIKMGHRVSDATDLLYTQGTCTWFSA
ncbi:bifunctional hydroxymethylpyrimidine kinase/phosphomethylpyrimidine kinase, partial [Eubacterium aggregans]|uniref:bifunctional hydroxymethylpyrimidine kinase/phosphomethylpyrimidine kinase n=1 Tax=Eubacterium aggregans TaxID=81409 RepID=UPI003F368C55